MPTQQRLHIRTATRKRRQGENDLPWEVTCRNVVNGIQMVVHMTRREGQRFIEEAYGFADTARERISG